MAKIYHDVIESCQTCFHNPDRGNEERDKSDYIWCEDRGRYVKNDGEISSECRLPEAQVNGGKLDNRFWNCECKENYIHKKFDKQCSVCGAKKDEQPDSMEREVVDYLLKRSFESLLNRKKCGNIVGLLEWYLREKRTD